MTTCWMSLAFSENLDQGRYIMNSEIFESIIEITRQKDTDSLEYSLAATLAELIDVSEVTLLNVPFKGTPTYSVFYLLQY